MSCSNSVKSSQLHAQYNEEIKIATDLIPTTENEGTVLKLKKKTKLFATLSHMPDEKHRAHSYPNKSKDIVKIQIHSICNVIVSPLKNE